MSDLLIKGMEMPKTGLYFVGVDNSNGRDKAVITVERMLGNRDVRQIVGSFELIAVPESHGRLIEAEQLKETIDYYIREAGWNDEINKVLSWVYDFIDAQPTIIPTSEEGET